MPSADSARILVALATYNERDNLAPLVAEIQKTLPSAELLVIDDNSPDDTGRLADELAAGNPRLHVLHRPAKLGLGTAILAGMRYALEQNYDLFVNMDADFSHHPRYLPALLAGMDGHDVMIGSRYVHGGGSANWPLRRRLMSRGVNTLVSLLMRIPARDCSGAYRCYRISKLREVQLERVRSRGYSFQQEVLYRCRKASCKIGETPILFENRRAGKSKVDVREALRSIAMLFRIGVPAFFGLD
ncbi:MAG TPA: polyprenol monophosphomannose synthase [Gemmataceae bacterium]|nr:polyprenol monophosphomannose synthase [Gemmataceae bacterium]